MNYKEELTIAIRNWESCFKQLLLFVEEFDEKQQLFKTEDKAWNMILVMEHLMAAESGIAGVLKRNDPEKINRKIRFKDKVNVFLLRSVLRSPIKVKAPKVVAPAGKLSKNEILKKWLEARKSLLEMFVAFPESTRRLSVFKHPIAGPLSLIDTIGFMQWHIENHFKQVKRIAKHANFPKA